MVWVLVASITLASVEPTCSEALRYEPFADIYRGYRPPFAQDFSRRGRARAAVPDEEMKLSSEQSFFTLNLLEESDRANALVEAGKQKEAEGQFREALEIYQKVIDEYGDALYRVSEYGIFVPVTVYCQMRMLAFPREHLDYYRVKYDSRAREAMGLARQNYSLEGLAQIRDTLLATSYGAEALKTLGYSALDRGHYLEALEYFERVWAGFPERRVEGPDLALAMELCRKLLGEGVREGERYGLVGEWRFEEGKGQVAGDGSGLGHHGQIAGLAMWTEGKVGGALRFERTNSVSVAASRRMDIGVGGSDFSVVFWLKFEAGSYPNYPFIKRGREADEMLSVEVTRQRRVRWAVATGSPTWETGESTGVIEAGRWVHVALVKAGQALKLYLDGAMDSRTWLKEQVLRNGGGGGLGQGVSGCMDEVRLYNRALLDREVAVLAGNVGTASIEVRPAEGEAPLMVELVGRVPEGEKAEYFWEFGDGEVGQGSPVKHTYGLGGEYAVVLTVVDGKGRVSVGRSRIKVRWRPADLDFVRRMEQLLAAAEGRQRGPFRQLASPPHLAADNYVQMDPTQDPLGIKPPVWVQELPGSRLDFYVYTQPVVTDKSVIYRHKNIVYCRSILNGELRWMCDIGGRVTWQNWNERQYPLEDLLVQEGMVFTPIYKTGSTLVALDETTGRIRWSYGPMSATTKEEANTRFEAAPAGGPMTVYASYIMDNIEGDSHIDTEYGIMAFESATGRLRWRTPVCRLRPGQFAAGFAQRRRNRIRSFTSPPLYAQGIVYYCSNAGAVAAIDALSGSIKWVMRYPYYAYPDNVHDSTRQFGELTPIHGGTTFVRPHRPMFWLNQRPLLVEEHLYVLPVDSPYMLCLDRRTGKTMWSRRKMGEGFTYLLGPNSTGELVVVTNGRNGFVFGGGNGGPPVVLLNPLTGETIWQAPDIIMRETQPVMTHYRFNTCMWFHMNTRWFENAARPFLDSDDRLYIPPYTDVSVWWRPGCFVYHLAGLDLKERKIIAQRRYYNDTTRIHAQHIITEAAPQELKALEDLPHKDEDIKNQIRMLREILADTVPQNEYGPFQPFSRVTFDRYGTRFELRFWPRSVGMVYDRAAVQRALAGQNDPEGLFARAELALAESDLSEAARLMTRCLDTISSEDVDFRALINQQLFTVHKRLARSAVRRGDHRAELEHCLGMSRTATTIADEMETLFALSDAWERCKDFTNAAKQAQSIVGTYGHYEYPIPSVLTDDIAHLRTVSREIFARAQSYALNTIYRDLTGRALELSQQGLPLYFSTLSPLEKDLTVRAGEFAAARLVRLCRTSASFAEWFERSARDSLNNRPPDEQIARLWEFPGTRTAQEIIEKLLAATSRALAELSNREDTEKTNLSPENNSPGTSHVLSEAAALRRRLWTLADAARICGFALPEPFAKSLTAPSAPPPADLPANFQNLEVNVEEERGTAWLVLEVHGNSEEAKGRLFLGGRIRKKLDNKFVLYCLEHRTGAVLWKASEQRGATWFDEIRLKGQGEEPGFFEAFVYGDLVVVHGLYDVLAFDLGTGRLRWRYQVPFDFEIGHTIMSGDLLVLAGQSETVVLYIPTRDPRGEVVWQQKEEGHLYAAPWFYRDRLVSIRKHPFNVTVRYRSTGKLIGRLQMPDLLLHDEHPLLDNGPRELPVAHDGAYVAVTDGWYYIMVDIERMKIVWKRLIDQNDPTRLPPLRFALGGEYLAVLKQDYDVKTLYMLSSRTGEVLWRTDPKDAKSPQPMHSLLVHNGRLYGIRPHPGQGFFFAALDGRTGQELFSPNEQKGYQGKPDVTLRKAVHGGAVIALIRDRQDFELKIFDANTGRLMHTVRTRATGDFGEHGRASATASGSGLALLGGNKLWLAVGVK
ncbi:MAG: PQQ-binding-like beta-propeller repeat protein [Kiritimatiellae bacterium]|nr:PQQ-binding-like beta-propeller repeat protein [Kiritimatiellia bacterium]